MRDILITLLIIIGIIFIAKNSASVNEPTIITKIDTIYSHDTLTIHKKGKDIPFEIYRILTDTFTDTICHNFSNISDTIKVYSDTLRIDSSYFALKDTIRGELLGRSFKANIGVKTIYNTTTINLRPKKEVYLGILGDLRRFDNKLGIGVGLIYKEKNKAISVGLTTNQINLGYHVRIY